MPDIHSQKQPYDHQQVEPKWQQKWEETQLFQDSFGEKANQERQAKGLTAEDKMYLLFAFAYPSGSGLHVGHVESKTALDIMARYYRMAGKDVFFPVGWDAFGLPAENYAIKTGVPPAETTKNAIQTFRRQLKQIGISYDWANELATCHPEYYQWTQWIFAQLYEAGLAYKDTGMVNWCPSCQTVLANEQVVEGLCERCDTQVEQKDLEQWFFKITKYQDELIAGLDEVDWPTPTKQQQINWIGKSKGVNVKFSLKKKDKAEHKAIDLTCFTTRIDTIFGASFVVISPEKFKELELGEFVPAAKQQKVAAYIKQAFKKTEEERRIGEKDKTGVDTGLRVINPVNEKEIPLYVADYVLAGVGTGVVMGVPAHDERDFAFAKKHGLEIVPVVKPEQGEVVTDECFAAYGVAINSGKYDGLTTKEVQEQMVADYPKIMEKTTTYKLRDWLISRQRYWGAPIPVIYDPEGEPHLVKDKGLPWKLPEDVDFKPTGESPLKSSQEFMDRTEKYAAKNFEGLIKEKGWDESGKGWVPEFDTMDTFVDSSWYYLRYLDSRSAEQMADKAKMDQWMPVDFYLIGPEHIVLHLLYSRFFTKFFRDQGYLDLPSGEPFAKMRHQGMILGPDHKKMSKSKGNVINPDEIVEQYGADTLRVYEMFMGPLEADKPWDDRAVQGVSRFLHKFYDLVVTDAQESTGQTPESLQRKLHQTIKKVGKDIPQLKFNTAIAAMMELSNEWKSSKVHQGVEVGFNQEDLEKIVKMLSPFAPFMAEELWSKLGQEYSVHQQDWPSFDSELAQEEELVIPVQINGKLRGELQLPADYAQDFANKEEIIQQAKKLETIQKWTTDKEIKKEIFVPGKVVSLVVS